MKKIRSIIKFFYYLFKYEVDFGTIFGIQNNNRINNKVKIYIPCNVNNCEIGDYTYIAKGAVISYTKIGKYCSIGPNFLCGWGIHPLNGISTSPMFYSIKKQNGYSISKGNKIEERKSILIGNDVFIGSNVTVLDGITIGNGAVIGAGAVVSKDIPPYAIAVGCPIKILRYRFSQEIIEELEKMQWWNDEEKQNLIEEDFFDVEKFIYNNEHRKK